MFRADALSSGNAAAFATIRDEIALPLGRGDGAGFGAMMGSVRDEVTEFIKHGSPDMGLNASGQVWRERLRDAGRQAESALRDTTVAKAEAVRTVERAVFPATVLVRMDEAQREFLTRIAPWARDAGRRLGVAPEIVAAQAALESGWGLRAPRDDEGGETHNFFGIKAGSRWQGEVVERMTTEYEDGVAVRRRERFRSYDSAAGAFRDFADLLSNNARYGDALNTGGNARAYADALLRGGYATDPLYADKLVRIAAQLQRGK